jgi:hypothetical protein
MSLEAIPGAALLEERDCISHDLRSGRLELEHRIDVHNEPGKLVHTLLFADACSRVMGSIPTLSALRVKSSFLSAPQVVA